MINHPPLYILRHAETEWNVQGRLQGSFDSALTTRGHEQAQSQRDILSRCDLSKFIAISSPQGRAVETATRVLDGLIAPIQQDSRLREIGLGDWAGQERGPLLATHKIADGFALYEHAPGGEGFAALHTRCAAFLNSLSGPAVLMTHGITSRMLRLIILGHPIDFLPQMEGGQGVVFQLFDNKQTRLTKRC